MSSSPTLMGLLTLGNGNTTVKAIKTIKDENYEMAMEEVIGYDLYVQDEITDELTVYSFNQLGVLDSSRNTEGSFLTETIGIAINPVDDALCYRHTFPPCVWRRR